MEKKLDRRVQRTRHLLSDALLALVLEKGYDAVTIQDITDHANLGRATFYLHYRDKEDLLMHTLEAVFDDLVHRLAQAAEAMQSADVPLPMLFIFHHAAEHSDLYRALFQAQGGHTIIWRIQEYMAKQIQEIIAIQSPDVDSPVPMALWTNTVAGAFLTLVRWWLENDMPYSPEYMEHAFRQVSLPGIFRMMGHDMDLLDDRCGPPTAP